MEISLKLGIQFYYPHLIYHKMNLSEISLISTGIFLAFVLLLLRKFSWFFFIASISLLVYNIMYFSKNLNDNNIISFIHTKLILIMIMYLMQRDIFYPFFLRSWEGFRNARRYLLEIPVEIDGLELNTINISLGGMLLDWCDCDISKGEQVSVSFNINENYFEFKGEIINIYKECVGIAFKELSEEEIKKLKNSIKSLL